MQKNMAPLKHYVLAFTLACFVFIVSLLLVVVSAKYVDSDIFTFPVTSLIAFYGYLALIYTMSVLFWLYFSSTSTTLERRTLREAIIDTGLTAVGKYVPGKVIGILARGAFKDGSFALSKASAASSASEQIYSLGSGIIIVVAFILYQLISFHVVWILTLLLLLFSYAPTLIRSILKSSSLALYLPYISPLKAFALSVGYIVLWLISSMPMLTLIGTKQNLDFNQVLEIVAAFTGSIIAGWVAIFSPGGIGIREAAFAVTAPDWLDWKQGLYWITMHRSLCIMFDLVFGGVSIIYLIHELRRKNSRT